MTPNVGMLASLHTENNEVLPGEIVEVFADGTVSIRLESGSEPHVPFVEAGAETVCANFATPR